jgi:hypothetical protein
MVSVRIVDKCAGVPLAAVPEKQGGDGRSEEWTVEAKRDGRSEGGNDGSSEGMVKARSGQWKRRRLTGGGYMRQ